MINGCSHRPMTVRHDGARVVRRSPHLRSVIATAVATGVLAISATACSPKDETTETGCASTVHDASLAAEVTDQIRMLDMAMVRCRSLQDLTAEMGKYPGIVGYDLNTF